ncbi:Dot/Icm T4SS effector CegC4 [Legionella pneumophila serogroup 1]
MYPNFLGMACLFHKRKNMLTINREKFEEIKNQLKEKQLVCNQIAQWKKTPLWLREMTHQPEIPPNFLNELRQIRDAIVSFEIDKNTLGLAVFYNELYKLLAPSYNVLTPIDTDHMNNHVLLLQRISNYAGKVDEHIKSLSASEVKHLDYAEFWSLLSETCSIQEVDRRKQAKEKFSQSIFLRLCQYNPKIYLDIATRLEEPAEQSNTLDF